MRAGERPAAPGPDVTEVVAAQTTAVRPRPMVLVLVCSSNACRRRFEPDPVALAGGSLVCPSCGGWVFHAELTEPASGGEQ